MNEGVYLGIRFPYDSTQAITRFMLVLGGNFYSAFRSSLKAQDQWLLRSA